MTRTTWALAIAIVLVFIAAAGVVVATSGGTDATPAAAGQSPDTATVDRGRLAAMVSVNGTLAHRARPDGSPYAVVNRAGGTYTRLPAAGDTVGCGDVLYRVDEVPVLLLCGTIPAYRDLHEGDAGADVRQLNRNLHALGDDRAAGVAVDPRDRDFTSATGAALAALQRRKGLAVSGTLMTDGAVFLPRPLRIAKVTAQLGGTARQGATVAQATSDALEVRVDLDAAQQGQVRRGDRARIALPDNRSVRGTVSRIGRVARTAGGDDAGGSATIPAAIRLGDARRVRGLDSAPVRVEIATAGVENALSVPVTALVGRAGGGFAVEVVRAGGRRESVAVTLGLVDTTAGRAQVEGDLVEGDDVVVPAR